MKRSLRIKLSKKRNLERDIRGLGEEMAGLRVEKFDSKEGLEKRRSKLIEELKRYKESLVKLRDEINLFESGL